MFAFYSLERIRLVASSEVNAKPKDARGYSVGVCANVPSQGPTSREICKHRRKRPHCTQVHKAGAVSSSAILPTIPSGV